MKTTPLYLEDPYLKTLEATILEVTPESEGLYKIILDQTIFYPMGGGQPTDQGTLIFSDGTKAEVNQVRLVENEIVHFIKIAEAPTPGQAVTGNIDWERRHKNMRVHTGGHVIDFALFLLGYIPAILKPLKGDHGKKPFIVYEGTLGKDITNELQNKVNELLAADYKFSWCFKPLEKLEKEALYLQPGLPKNKPLRALTLEGVGTVADGGTILSSTKEAGKITVLSIETTNNETTIRYKID